MRHRILFVDHAGVLGGGELSLLDIAGRFRETGAVVLMSDGPFRGRLEQEGVRVHLFQAGRALLDIRREGGMPPLGLLPGLIGMVWKLARKCRDYDLVYANSQKAFVLSALAGRLAGRPVLWHLRDFLGSEHFGRSRLRLATSLANSLAERVVANSEATKQAFMRAGGRPELVRVVHNGIEPGAFLAVSETAARAARAALGLSDEPLLGVFGRLHQWKGQHVLLDAMRRLPGVQAIVVGDALFGEEEYTRALWRQAGDPEIRGRVHFLGHREDVPLLMCASDIVVHTSIAPEPFGRVVVEGMLAGRPVVASRAGGVVEIVEPGLTGLLVEPGDPDALARALAELLADPAARVAMGRAGRNRALLHFSADAMLAAVAAQIEEVLSARGRPRSWFAREPGAGRALPPASGARSAGTGE